MPHNVEIGAPLLPEPRERRDRHVDVRCADPAARVAVLVDDELGRIVVAHLEARRVRWGSAVAQPAIEVRERRLEHVVLRTRVDRVFELESQW